MASATKLVKMETGSITSPRLLTPAQVAESLGIPEGTLAQWRSQRRGPAFIKLEGRLVRYRARDLENYIAGCIVEPVANGDA
jgi:hypothetical protein